MNPYVSFGLAHIKTCSHIALSGILLEVNKIRSGAHSKASAGSPLYQNVCIGGQKLNEDGVIVEAPAHLLKPGDQLVVPRRLPIKGMLQEIDPYSLGLEDAVVRDDRVAEEVAEAAKVLVERLGGYKRAAQRLGISRHILRLLVKGGYNPKLSLIKKIYEELGMEPPTPEKLSLAKSRTIIKMPRVLDEGLAELIGLVLSSGEITERAVKFFNTDASARERFKLLAREVFGIDAREYETAGYITLNSRLIAMILKALGVHVVAGQKPAIPAMILRSPDGIIKAFIRGYYIGSGSFRNGRVELPAGSKELASGLAYILARLGVFYSVEEEPVKNRKYYKIVITSSGELELFYNAIKDKSVHGYTKLSRIREYLETGKWKSRPRGLLRLNTTNLKKSFNTRIGGGQEKVELYSSNYTVIQSKLAVLMSMARSEVLEQSTYISDSIAIDVIENVEVVEGDFVVYDLTVPVTHNFVGGVIPSILHNTVTLHSLAQWSSAKVVVYIGCGERGNEMTEVLERFPKYKDPWSGKPLMERTILIANTSNMPVAAREASIYVGVTLAEYYRDMGYDVLLVADSTSRWAEALREIAGRLEEMPAEEGYPSYLASRLAEFYERAGRVVALGSPERNGSVTIVGAVSPPGGDFTEPVTSHTKRFIRVFWALDTKLAYSRHYPAINWLLSYSAYTDLVSEWWHKNVDTRWKEYRDEAMEILLREDELQEIVRLVGTESLDEKDKLILDTARLLKDGFLKQNAFDPIDAFSTPEKQFKLLKMILDFHKKALHLVELGATAAQVRDALGRLYVEMVKAKFSIKNDELEKIEDLRNRVIKTLESLEARLG